MSTQLETRALFLRLFLEGRFIPKIEALADAADPSIPGSCGDPCPACEKEPPAIGTPTCPLCNHCFKSHHPRNHHATDGPISMNSVCVHCGEALLLGDIVGHASVEILPCPECYPSMSAADLKDTTYYFQL